MVSSFLPYPVVSLSTEVAAIAEWEWHNKSTTLGGENSPLCYAAFEYLLLRLSKPLS